MNYNKKLKDMTYEELVEVAKYMLDEKHYIMMWNYYFFEDEWSQDESCYWDENCDLYLTMPYVCLYAEGCDNKYLDYFIDFDRCEEGSMDFTLAEWEAVLNDNI